MEPSSVSLPGFTFCVGHRSNKIRVTVGYGERYGTLRRYRRKIAREDRSVADFRALYCEGPQWPTVRGKDLNYANASGVLSFKPSACTSRPSLLLGSESAREGI